MIVVIWLTRMPAVEPAHVRKVTRSNEDAISCANFKQHLLFLREKVLHYLAIRPIRLQDLITRLARGTTHVDKGKVQHLLNQVQNY